MGVREGRGKDAVGQGAKFTEILYTFVLANYKIYSVLSGLGEDVFGARRNAFTCFGTGHSFDSILN